MHRKFNRKVPQQLTKEIHVGLAERRVTKDFSDNHFPKLFEEIKAAAKFDVEVDWTSMSEDGSSHL